MITPHKEYIITKIESGENLLQIHGRNFLVGEVIFDTLRKNLECESEFEVYKYLLNKYGFLSYQKIDTLITYEISKIFKSDRKMNEVKKLFSLFDPDKMIPIMKFLSFFYSIKNYWSWFCIMSIINLSMFFVIRDQLILGYQEILSNWLGVIFFIPFVFCLHELGHVVAAFKFGVISKEIGFGIYFIYPVLYTDLSDIWRLDRLQRLIINSAGINFQLIIGMFLGLAFFLTDRSISILIIMFCLNFFLIVFNLNPLMKFDGYWIFSDYFRLPNLRLLSKKVLLSFIRRSEFPLVNSKHRTLIITYSIAYFLFTIVVLFFLYKSLVLSFLFLYNAVFFDDPEVVVIELLFRIIWLMMIAYFAIRILLIGATIVKKTHKKNL